MFKRIYPTLNIDEAEFLLMWSGSLGRTFSVLLAVLALLGGVTGWITERYLQAGIMGLSILVVFFVVSNLLMASELRRIRRHNALMEEQQEFDLSEPRIGRGRKQVSPLISQRKYIDPTNDSWDNI